MMSEWVHMVAEPGPLRAWGLDFSAGLGDLWPVAVVCAASVLCMVLWLLAVRACLRPRGGLRRGARVAS